MGSMNRELGSLLSLYKYPVILFLIVIVPGVNSFLFFEQHAVFSPIVGILVVYSLPLCAPYLLIRLIILSVKSKRRWKVRDNADKTPKKTPDHLPAYAVGSYAGYLALSFPVSAIMAISLNWSGTWGIHWNRTILQKMITFPLGFLIPPFVPENHMTMSFILSIFKGTLR
jgi:hypothetical protein